MRASVCLLALRHRFAAFRGLSRTLCGLLYGPAGVLRLDACWFEDEAWRGYLLTATDSWLLDRHVFVTWVAGVSHHAEATQDPSFAPGEDLLLVPEPDNPHDPQAVSVWNAGRIRTAGYVPHVVVRFLVPTPEQRRAKAMWEQLGEGRRTGIGMMVSREPVTLRAVTLPVADARRRVATLPHPPLYPWHGTNDPVEQMTRMLDELRENPRPGHHPG
jgi:hypothetical protein